MSKSKITETKEIIQKPSTGRKVVSGIGIVVLSLTILFAAVLLFEALARNANVGLLVGPMLVILVMIIISALMIRVGRTRREIVVVKESEKEE